MSILNFSTYDNQLSILNDNNLGYLLQDDLYVSNSGSWNSVKDAYVYNTGAGWNQIRQAYVYTNGQWQLSYRKAFRFYVEISSTLTNVDIVTYLKSLSTPWDGASPIKGIFKINSSGIIGSTDATRPALNIPSLPANSSLVIINEGSIYGQGGNGGTGGGGDQSGTPGQNGGDCIDTYNQNPTTKIYYSSTAGKLWAGGGGGGGGGDTYGNDDRHGGGGGGGGQGYTNSSGGGANAVPGGYQPGIAGSPGSNGSFNSPGNGGAGGPTNGFQNYGGDGGNGGSWGQDGGRGKYGYLVSFGSCDIWNNSIDQGDCGDTQAGGNSRFNKKGGERGRAGYIINGVSNIIALTTIPSATNGYINTSNYKGRIV